MLGSELGLEAINVGSPDHASCSLGRVHKDAIGQNLEHFWTMKPKAPNYAQRMRKGAAKQVHEANIVGG